jgi:hypothetical protein
VPAGQIRGTHQAGVRPQLSKPDVGEITVAAAWQGTLVGPARRVDEQAACFRYTAADHETAWVDDRGQVGHALP